MSILGSLKNTKRTTLQHNVYELLKLALMSGEFRPGQPLTYREVAEMAGTSLMPVRGAIARLITDGALQHLPNGTIRVALLTHEQRSEAREIRASLEGLAIRRAAARISNAEILQIEHLNNAMWQALGARDVHQFVQQNREFHFAIYRAAHSDQLFNMIEGLWMESGPFLFLYSATFLTQHSHVRYSRDAHSQMIRALRAGDAEAAVRALQQDIASTEQLGDEKDQPAPGRKVKSFQRTPAAAGYRTKASPGRKARSLE